MRVLSQIQYFDIVKLDVEVLIDALQSSANTNIILQLDGDSAIRESFEKAFRFIVR